MEIYDVNPTTVRIPRGARLARQCTLFAIYALLYFIGLLVADRLWLHDHRSSVGMLVQATLWASFMTIASTFLKVGHYQILVDDEEMSTNFNSRNHLFSRTVRRGEVKTLIQRRHGLLISEHNRIGTYFWGGVWVPKELADYEYLKRLAMSWKASPAA